MSYFSGDVTLHDPPSFFEDKTKDIIHWDELINSYSLPNLRDACNKYLVPTILRPFGCSEFIHKCGHVAIDMIFQRYIPKCILLPRMYYLYVVDGYGQNDSSYHMNN